MFDAKESSMSGISPVSPVGGYSPTPARVSAQTAPAPQPQPAVDPDHDGDHDAPSRVDVRA